MLPRLSKIDFELRNEKCTALYFFIEVEGKIRYAVSKRCDRLWWNEFVDPWKGINVSS